MIQEQVIAPRQENANGDVEPHVESHGGDILNLSYYNPLPHLSFQVERMGRVFFVNFLLQYLY